MDTRQGTAGVTSIEGLRNWHVLQGASILWARQVSDRALEDSLLVVLICMRVRSLSPGCGAKSLTCEDDFLLWRISNIKLDDGQRDDV